MGSQVHLLRSLPQTTRDFAMRRAAKKAGAAAIARRFGEEYFDGPREFGYGGYRYDGRWMPVARNIVAHFDLREGRSILDVGCAKGFLVRDIRDACPGVEAFGIDVSRYAVVHACQGDVIGRLHVGHAASLPFPTDGFDAAVSINTLHNLERPYCVTALRELQRVSGGRAFVQVDAYRNDEEKARFEDWVLTAKTHGTPEFWLDLFAEAGYTGDYDWTVA
jgi:SAM-dependent methyltransferase